MYMLSYKTLTRKRKEALDKNNKSGNSPYEVPFDEEMREISAQDDSIEPDVLRGIDYVKTKETTPVVKKPRWQKPKEDSLQKTLLEIQKRREDLAHEREDRQDARHQKTLELIKTIFQK